jgi:hypothetical protein
MNWEIGQDIVAIKDHSQCRFKEGEVFTIKGLQGGTCKCTSIEIDIGIKSPPNSSGYSYCTNCNTRYKKNSGIWWFSENIFAPLDSLADISELTEHLETTKPFEV